MYKYDHEKIFTRLAGYFAGAGMTESLRALYYARKMHDGQTRKNGQPYIIHPLWMANYAVNIGIRDDIMIAVVLLHDVVEDTDVKLEDLPFSDPVKEGVKFMTITYLPGETKEQSKARYFHGLLNSKAALLCKGLDRFMNLSTMEGQMSEESIRKNVVETNNLLLPVMKEAKEQWPELSGVIFVLRANIVALNDTLSAAHGISFPEHADTLD